MDRSTNPGGMYVAESGTPGSPAIVFLHGGGQSGREWRGHMVRLRGFHCLAPDLPGHGHSNHLPSASPGEIADLVAELIQTHVPARRASVVSVSWAGAVVHALLDRHPDLVERAVLDGSPMFRYIAPRGITFLAYVFLTALSPFMHTRPVVALFHGTHDPADLRAASRRAILRAVWVKTSAATGSASSVLLVAGEKEGYVRQADAALATLMPHAEARFAPGLGHCWQRKAPDLHIRMVEAWVSGQELPAELQPEPAPSPAAVERMRASARPRGPMYVEESGTPGTPAIVLIHGAGQSGRIWRGHMARLSEFHCLAPDLPGFGRSDRLPPVSLAETADLLAELIETRVPARRASIVGISSGGWVIRALLDRHPDRVERAIIDGAPVRPWGRRFRVLFFSAVSPFIHTRPVMAAMRGIWDAVDLRVASRRAFRRSVTEGFLKPFAAIGVLNPTLFVAGERETNRTLTGCGVRESNAALAALMPHAEARFTPGLGHCWQRKAPELHIRMVEAWCSGQELPSELRREPPPSPAAVERMRRMTPGNWYVQHRSRIKREVRFSLRHYRKHFAEAYGKAEGKAIARETLQRFEVLLPALPYIGGDANRNTRSLYMTAAWLAMYRSLQARGASVEEAGRLIYLGAASFFESLPMRWLLRWQGRSLLGRKRIEQSKRRAAISQERRYPDDWVFEVVEGAGHGFVIGTDYTECGVVKYLAREGAPELAPYLCWIDYPSFAAAGLRLDRTETIAQGGRRCDFRMSRGKPVQVEPEFLHV